MKPFTSLYRLPAFLWASLLSAGLSGCAQYRAPEQFLEQYLVSPPQPKRFEVCNRFGCDSRTQVSYSVEQWRRIDRLFQPPSGDALQERRRIAQAIAQMEAFTGVQAGTAEDLPRNAGWLSGTRQLDCIAESANTTVSLLLLQQRGHIRFHRVLYPLHRGFVHLQSPHNAAGIQEQASGQAFVVDSWFFGNGVAPVVVSLERWQSGFDPDRQ